MQFKLDDHSSLEIKEKSAYNCELMARFFRDHLLPNYHHLALKRVYSPTTYTVSQASALGHNQDEEMKTPYEEKK